MNTSAYPVITVDREKQTGIFLEWAWSCAIHPLGRWGKWEHINSDVAVARAMGAAKTYIGDRAHALGGAYHA